MGTGSPLTGLMTRISPCGEATLARLETGEGGGILPLPASLRLAHHAGAIGFGEAIDMGHGDPHGLHAGDHGGGRRSPPPSSP